MSAAVVSPIEAEPYFDLELFMTVSQETRVGADIMDRLTTMWERWQPHAHALKIADGNKAYLLVWLGSQVEDDVDDAWENTPSEAFLLNALAQVMCMGLVHAILPEVEEMGCAPAAPRSTVLAKALEEAGVPYASEREIALSRRYAVVTHMPFRGGCEICALRDACPKANGDGPHSIVLPGHE